MIIEGVENQETWEDIEKEHVENLFDILGHEEPCSWCPSDGESFYCWTCWTFIGGVYSVKRMNDGERFCPCHVLGKEEAIKRTWLALEEKGYTD